MPAPNHLNESQREMLLNELRENNSPLIRDRILILLLINDGKIYEQVAKFLQIFYPTVAYWSKHGDPDKLDSFKDGRAEGNHKKSTKEYIDMLLILIDKEPSKFGYEFGRWTAARLAKHLEKETGIHLSESQVRRILKSKKYVFIWAKYSLEDRQNRLK